MKILDRYLSRQILSTVIWAVGLLTMILVLGNVLRDLLGLLLSHQVPITYILTFIGYLLPFSMIYSIPWGVLVAVLLVFGKLSSDNELVALRANGDRYAPNLFLGLYHRDFVSRSLSLDQSLRCADRSSKASFRGFRSRFNRSACARLAVTK